MSKDTKVPIIERRYTLFPYKEYATIKEIQDVWAFVTKHPETSIRRMESQLGMKRIKIRAVLDGLEAGGYIKHIFGMTGRTVTIPLGEMYDNKVLL